MSSVEVCTCLVAHSVNLLTLGQPVQVVVPGVGVEVPGVDVEEKTVAAGGEAASEPSPNSPDTKDEVTATATRLLTGEVSTSDLQVVAYEGPGGGHVVRFNPRLTEKEDYELAVLHRGQHVRGSPFLLCYIHTQSLSSVHTEKISAVADARRGINLVLPLGGRGGEEGEVTASVEGPFGRCEVDVRCKQGSASLSFTPKGAGAYSVSVMVDGEEFGESPYLILADYTAEEARRCYVLSDDKWVFEKPHPFMPPSSGGGGQSFRVSTKRASQGHTPLGEGLTVSCAGPGKARVTLAGGGEEEGEEWSGMERCEVVPTTPGEYRLSVLWRGHHITGSPFFMTFEPPNCPAPQPQGGRKIRGLDLQERAYKVGVAHTFKLNCSELDTVVLEVTCQPPSAASITISLLEGAGSVYRCELLPLQAGSHTLTVRCDGTHVEGSPFDVEFHNPPTSDPSACKIIRGTRSFEPGGHLEIKISTKGAGSGTLGATAQDPDTDTSLPLVTSRVADDLYQLDLDPGESLLCLLSVTFDLRHIPGSPFRLALSDPEKFRVGGAGLTGGCVGVWHSFLVTVPGPAHSRPLKVKVRREGGGATEGVETRVSAGATPQQFEVQYFPKVPGEYIILVRWGQIPIPGSPFRIRCTSAEFGVRDPPKRVEVGSPLEFRVHLDGGGDSPHDVDEEEGVAGLRVVSRTPQGRELKGVVSLLDQEKQIYNCMLVPRQPGKHTVGVIWNRLHVRGSPFLVRVVARARPELVCVSGRGIEKMGGEVGEGLGFVVDTSRGGSGLLGIRIRGPSRHLKFQTSRDPVQKRTLHVEYHPTLPGDHQVEVEWAGLQVPGSPFRVKVREKRHVLVMAEVHPETPLALDMEGAGPQGKWEESASGDQDTTSQCDIESLVSVSTEIEQSDVESVSTGVEQTDLESAESASITAFGAEQTPPPISLASDAAPSKESGYGSDSTHQEVGVACDTTQLDTRSLSDDQLSIHLEGSVATD